MNKKRNYKVYVHINKINGKRYYGITSQKKSEYRWRNGLGYKSNEYFYRAIQKYGWDNFKHIILFEGLTEEEAKLMEQFYIALYGTNNRDKGYNISLGGEGGNGCSPSKETKKKLSEASKKMWQNEEYRQKISESLRGIERSEEWKRKISEANKGKVMSEEARQKISEANKGKVMSEEARQKMSENNPNKKVIYIIELDLTFDSIEDCVEYFINHGHNKCNRTSISRVLIGERKTLYGYHIIYAKDKDNKEVIDNVMEYEGDKGQKKTIYVRELNMEFESLNACARYIGCHRNSISNTLKGKQDTCKGYHIIYAKDRDKLAS